MLKRSCPCNNKRVFHEIFLFVIAWKQLLLLFPQASILRTLPNGSGMPFFTSSTLYKSMLSPDGRFPFNRLSNSSSYLAAFCGVSPSLYACLILSGVKIPLPCRVITISSPAPTSFPFLSMPAFSSESAVNQFCQR